MSQQSLTDPTLETLNGEGMAKRPSLAALNSDKRQMFASNKGKTASGLLDLHEKEFDDIEIELSEEGSSDGLGDVIVFNTEEPWINGFVDLIYVATIMNISHLLAHCGNAVEVWIMAAVYFCLMFMTRHNIDMLSIVFKTNDLAHRLIFCFYCLGVFLMTLNIAHKVLHHEDDHGTDESASYDNGTSYGTDENDHRRLFTSEGINYLGDCAFEQDYVYGFAAGFVFTRFAIVSLYTLAYTRSHSAAHKLQHLLKAIPCVASLIIMSCAFGGLSPYVIYAVAGLVEFLVNILPQLYFPVHSIPKTEVIQERLGLFFMLVLGESMIGMLSQAYNVDEPGKSYADLVFSFLLMFSLGMQFFDTVHRSTEMDNEIEEKQLARIKITMNMKLDEKIKEKLTEEKIYDGDARDARRKQLKRSFEFVEEFREELKQKKEELEAKTAAHPFEHALDSMNPFVRVPYVWLHCTVSFFMLIATNGFVTLYTANNGDTEVSHSEEYKDQLKVSGGLFIVCILMIVMRGCHYKGGPIVYWCREWPRILLKVAVAIVHLMVFEMPIKPEFNLLTHSCIAFFNNFVEIGWHALNTYYGVNETVGEAIGTVSTKITNNVKHAAMVIKGDSNSDCGDIEMK